KPELFNIRLKPYQHGGFARNQLPFEYLDNVLRSERIFDCIVQVMEWYQRGHGLDDPVHEFFKGIPVPAPTVKANYVEETVKLPDPGAKTRKRLVWLGGLPAWSRGLLSVRAQDGQVYTRAAPRWMADHLRRCHPDHWGGDQPPSRTDFESQDWYETFRWGGL